MSSDEEMELNPNANDVFKESDENSSSLSENIEKEKPVNSVDNENNSQTVRPSVRAERQESVSNSNSNAAVRPRSAGQCDNFNRSRSPMNSTNVKRRHFSSPPRDYRQRNWSGASASSSRSSSYYSSGSSRPSTPYSRDGCLRGKRPNPDPSWTNQERTKAALDHTAKGNTLRYEDINDYPADFNLSIKEEEEDHYFVVDCDWDEFQRLHVAYKVKFICLPEATVGEMADKVIDIINTANPRKRTYISASIFNRQMETNGHEGIKNIVNKISAHIKVPKDNWEKKRFLPEAGPMPNAYKVYLTFPTIIYRPSIEFIWPETALINQFLKTETIALVAVPMNMHQWVTKDAKEDRKLLETRGSMFQEFVNKTGLGSNLSRQAQERITIGILKHHSDGIHMPANSANKPEIPPIPLHRTGGYKINQANNHNHFIHPHMGAMEARIITQMAIRNEAEKLAAVTDRQVDEYKTFIENTILNQIIEKENNRKNDIKRQAENDEVDRQRAVEELRAEAAEAEAERLRKKKKREEQQELNDMASSIQNDLRKRLDQMKTATPKTSTIEPICVQASSSNAKTNLTAEGQQQLIEEWKAKAYKFRDNMEHVSANYVRVNAKYEQVQRERLVESTEAEKSLQTAEQAVKAAQTRITALEQQISRDNASMEFFRSQTDEKNTQINKLTEDNKVLQDKLNEVTHSLKVSKEINLALKQQVFKKK